nr:PREDICTED: golgin subfamily A member 6-like protein 22 [Megachile rotundata]XP_012150553.1 PREDICTED: golgin subfamily A member 6-like protein 22 [Megachile rotundata]XP_012150554.1 PREDICTED: golgin subfamily A member 6-like protein 22 [Megachile rotundata]XP_012150555.1 PREDICTED: golgin subfamily A member 6-like protein 22 [Megachile rotundata]
MMEETEIDNIEDKMCEKEEKMPKEVCDTKDMCEKSEKVMVEDVEKLENWDMEFLKEDEEEVLATLGLCNKNIEEMDREEVKDCVREKDRDLDEENKESSLTRRNIGERKRVRDASSEEEELRKKEKKESELEDSKEESGITKGGEEWQREEKAESVEIGNTGEERKQLVKLETVAPLEEECAKAETLEKGAEIVHSDGVGERKRTDCDKSKEVWEEQQRKVEKGKEEEA